MSALRFFPSLALVTLVFGIAGCANDLPHSSNTISQAAQDAPYPKLLPLDELLSKAETGSSVSEDVDALERRLAVLKARAGALRNRSVFDGATRLRLIEAGQRNAARL